MLPLAPGVSTVMTRENTDGARGWRSRARALSGAGGSIGGAAYITPCSGPGFRRMDTPFFAWALLLSFLPPLPPAGTRRFGCCVNRGLTRDGHGGLCGGGGVPRLKTRAASGIGGACTVSSGIAGTPTVHEAGGCVLAGGPKNSFIHSAARPPAPRARASALVDAAHVDRFKALADLILSSGLC